MDKPMSTDYGGQDMAESTVTERKRFDQLNTRDRIYWSACAGNAATVTRGYNRVDFDAPCDVEITWTSKDGQRTHTCTLEWKPSTPVSVYVTEPTETSEQPPPHPLTDQRVTFTTGTGRHYGYVTSVDADDMATIRFGINATDPEAVTYRYPVHVNSLTRVDERGEAITGNPPLDALRRAVTGRVLSGEAEAITEQRAEVEPHAYVPSGVPQWRTCARPDCGRGANASVHRTQ